MHSYTRNYSDNSTEAGFQFTFYCDNCNDGFKSSFVESSTYHKGQGIMGLARGAGMLGSIIGGRASSMGWAVERAGNVISDRFDGRSPEWQREHDAAFQQANHEVAGHFHRCHACHEYVCDSCYNENEGMCVSCAPRQEVYVARARADAMRRNIDEAAATATVWQGAIESKTTVCPGCGHPAGNGKFCNNCGHSLALNECPRCGERNAQGVKFCNNCGMNLAGQVAAAAPAGLCPSCGTQNQPGTRFCGACGTKL